MASITSSINLNDTPDTTHGKPKKVISYKGTTTTGDATKDAAKYFEKGMNDLAAKYGTTIERPEEENNSAEANGQSLKMISQETFDEVVKENIEDFEMTPEEALKDAIEQFHSQGINLSNIIKVLDNERKEMPIPSSLGKIKRAENVPTCIEAMKEFEALCSESEENKLQACNEAYEAILFNAVEKFFISKEAMEVSERDEDEIKTENKSIMIASLNAFSSCFWKGRVGNSILYPIASQMIISIVKKEEFSKDMDLLRVAVKVARITMTRNESVKGNFFEANGIKSYIKQWFQIGFDANDISFLKEVCDFVRVLCSDDDRRLGVHPYTFARARLLGERGKIGKLDVLEEVFKVLEAVRDDADVASKICLTIRTLAVNDNICKDITKLGGTELLVKIMNQHIEHVKFCTYACTAIKMISNNDANKALLCANGGIDIILNAMSRHSDDVAMQTQGLAALTSMALRNTKNCVHIAKGHGISLIVDAMTRHPNAEWLQRSGCLALRNLVSKNPELVPAIIEAGAEDPIRLARLTHPACDDVAFAALRDLGLKGTYKDETSAGQRRQ
jgi:armadillo repeat-containing protein 6